MIFMFVGYKASAFFYDKDKSFNLILKRSAVVCAVAAVIGCIVYSTGDLPEGALSFSKAVISLVMVTTSGGPHTLWFIPAAALGLAIIYSLKNKISIKKIFIAGAAVYALTLVISTYTIISPDFLEAVREVFEFVFSKSHCGVFSSLLFIAAGMFLAENEPAKTKKKYISLFILSLAGLVTEIVLLLKFQQLVTAYFFICSFPCSYFLFRIVQKSGDVKSDLPVEPVTFGFFLLIIGQFVCWLHVDGVSYNTFLANLFSTKYIAIETSVLFTCFFVFMFSAHDRKSGKPVTSFMEVFQSFVLYLLRPVARLSSKVDIRTRDVLSFISFGILPVLLWFVERLIAYEVCMKLFVVFFAVILFCTLDEELSIHKTPDALSAPFAAISFLVLFTSHMNSVLAFEQIGRMMLYFILPLSFAATNTKGGVKRLFKNYTDGLYLSFAVFCVFCFLLRPYDITRYRGAFCNANMCGLYTVTVCGVALCNLPNDIRFKDILKHPLHWIVFGSSFGFSLFTISRTTLVGLVAITAVKLFGVAFNGEEKRNASQKFRRLCSSSGIFLGIICFGTALMYTGIRFLPLLTGTPLYTLLELETQFEYKVLPGAGAFDSHFISPARFFEAWMNRSSVAAYSSADEMSTGRLSIYKEFLKNISLEGHYSLKLLIPSDKDSTYAHNVFLQIAYNCGIITGIAYLAYIVTAFFTGVRRCVKGNAAAITVSILIAGYAACGMFESMEMYIYPLLLAALASFMFLPDKGSSDDEAVCELEELSCEMQKQQ